MSKKARSARGEMVDFDLMQIKDQITSDPVPVDVQARQDHIDQRLRRRQRNVKRKPVTPSTANPTTPASPTTAPSEPPVEFIDAPVTAKPSRQKARKPQPSQD